jgi:hypothetical protein
VGEGGRRPDEGPRLTRISHPVALFQDQNTRQTPGIAVKNNFASAWHVPPVPPFLVVELASPAVPHDMKLRLPLGAARQRVRDSERDKEDRGCRRRRHLFCTGSKPCWAAKGRAPFFPRCSGRREMFNSARPGFSSRVATPLADGTSGGAVSSFRLKIRRMSYNIV